MSLVPRQDSGLWEWDTESYSWSEFKTIDSHHDFIVVGYPRSGNTFLNFAFERMYKLRQPNFNYHTVAAIEHFEKVFVPLRNPLDCIGSWAHYQKYYFKDFWDFKLQEITDESINDDISYYLRFYNAAIKMNSKITFLDFDYFTVDLGYIENKTGIEKIRQIDLEAVKLQMAKHDKKNNIPTNNQEILKQIKDQVSMNPRIKECYDLYNKAKEYL
jgi:hypothetical protein